jgi:septum formation protein
MTGSVRQGPLILASASPRRSEILTALGLEHTVVPADIPEVRSPSESPETYVERLAREKALAVLERHPDALVLAGDTTVALGDDILEKPADPADAVAMLLRLRGREHRVATGIALASSTIGNATVSGVEVTRVHFRDFSEAEARAYVATGEPMDKAGAYGIQGLGGVLVRCVEGDFSAVVGLSIPLLVHLLQDVGRPYRFPAPERPTPALASP